MGATVIDTRTTESISAEDRATLAQIQQKLNTKSPEDVFEEMKEAVITVTMRVPEVIYKLPSIRIDLNSSDTRISEVLL